MKTKDIIAQYNLNQAEFEKFLLLSRYKIKRNMLGDIASIEDDVDVEAVVAEYKKNQAAKLEEIRRVEVLQAAERNRANIAEAERRAAQEKAARDKKTALANMLITSGFNFDGYTITKYSGYISGDDAVQVDRGLVGGFWQTLLGVGSVNVKDRLLGSLVDIRRNALAELKEAAYALGCNAVIGVDFDYLTLDPETASAQGGTVYQPYVFAVTANGNAVIIEKND